MVRPQAYVVVSTDHGTMIVNRNDYNVVDGGAYGVGFQLLSKGHYDIDEINLVRYILNEKAKDAYVIAVDGGANIGVHTIEWAKLLSGRGSVLAFEAQEVVYYALAGNVAINNCFNVKAVNAAVGAELSSLEIPLPDYNTPTSFGSLELRQSDRSEKIGQEFVSTTTVPMVTIDSYDLTDCHFIKLDVEGMEMEALRGAEKTIEKFKPLMLIEVIKSDRAEIVTFLDGQGYVCHPFGGNFLAVHKSDNMCERISSEDGKLQIGPAQ